MTTQGMIDVRRAYSYLRFSSGRQGKGDSARRQNEFRERTLKKYEAILDDSLKMEDLGVSAFRGRNRNKGGLACFLDAINTGRVARGSILIIECLDRLSRQKVGEQLQLFISILNAGVTIATALPEREYTAASINDIASIMEAIIYMSRAHEESQTKSDRVRAAWGQKKKAAAEAGKPHTAMAPAWIELTPEGYRLIPERAATVRTIYRLAAEGLGHLRIVRELNAHPDLYPPFGSLRGNPCGKKRNSEAPRWNAEYVDRILTHRATLGEHQRYAVDPETGKKHPEGEPIAGFFPAAITEAEFYAARAAVAGRHRHTGRPAEGELNLFTGIVFNALDHCPMHLRSVTPSSKGKRRRRYSYLSSLAFKHGKPLGADGRFSRSIEYLAVRNAILGMIDELSSEDMTDRGSAGPDDETIRQLEKRRDTARQKKEMMLAKVRDPNTPANAAQSYTEMIDQFATEEATCQKQVEALKAEALSGRPEALGQLQASARQILEGAEGEEGAKLRRRASAQLRQVIEDVWVLVEVVGYNRRAAHIQVNLRGGGRRYTRVFCPPPPADKPAAPTLDLEGTDLRTFDAGQAAG